MADEFRVLAFCRSLRRLPASAAGVYDVSQPKRSLHPATIRGALVLFAAQAILSSSMGAAAWRHFDCRGSDVIGNTVLSDTRHAVIG